MGFEPSGVGSENNHTYNDLDDAFRLEDEGSDLAVDVDFNV